MRASSDKQSWREDNCVCGPSASPYLLAQEAAAASPRLRGAVFHPLRWQPHSCHSCCVCATAASLYSRLFFFFFPPPLPQQCFWQLLFLTRLIQWHERIQRGKVNSADLEFCPIWVSTRPFPSRHLGASANTTIAALDDDDHEGDGEDEVDDSPYRWCRLCLKRPKAVGCLSLVMTPDCINGSCLIVLSSTAPDLASQANRDRVRETTAKDVAVRAMVAATVTPLTPMWLLAFFILHCVL